jgi:tetratricopeptide (TPR) repeat protein
MRKVGAVGRGGAAAPAGTRPIFISYRRDDTSGYAGRLHDDLSDLFGPQGVFRDVVRIDPGKDFLQVIGDALESCAVMVVVIGREWLSSVDQAGQRRLDNPDDVLRLEVHAALQRDTMVIPVLVEKAAMPTATQLPEALRGLARRQAIELTDVNWDHDLARLAAAIEAIPGAPARRRPKTVGRKKLPARALAAVGGVLALILVVTGIRLISRGDAPVEPMTGRFNIAVAEFTQVDAAGDLVASSTASLLAKRFDRLVDQDVKAIDGGREVQHRLIGRLSGTDPEQRAAAAEEAAEELAADIVVYGVLQSDASSSVLTPEFYVTDRLLFDASEVVGHHQLGSPIRSPGDAERLTVQNQLLDQLAARSQVLAEATVALGSYSLGDFASALNHLLVAEQQPGWADEDGKEVLYLLLGNAAGKVGRLDDAEAYYDRALALRPDYSRASLGKAETIYHRAKGACEQGQIDADGLGRSLEVYAAARAGRLPAGAEVPAVAAFGEGRVLLCLSQALAGDRWGEAEVRFRQVIDAYGGRNPRLAELAAEAHANLGFIYRPAGPDEPGARDQYLRAAGEYQEAIALYQASNRSHDRQALYFSQLGYLFYRLGDVARADAAYADAIRLAPDPETAQEYQEDQMQDKSTAGASS